MVIGELSRKAGVNVTTIRYYESIGLMPQPDRTTGKHRRYGDGDLERLGFIRLARELGFEIEAIRELLAMTEDPRPSRSTAIDVGSRHIEGIERRLAHLTAWKEELSRFVGVYESGGATGLRLGGATIGHSVPVEGDRDGTSA